VEEKGDEDTDTSDMSMMEEKRDTLIEKTFSSLIENVANLLLCD
jgi:hypothetical protein